MNTYRNEENDTSERHRLGRGGGKNEPLSDSSVFRRQHVRDQSVLRREQKIHTAWVWSGPPDEVTNRSIKCCRLHYLHSRPKLWLSLFFSFWTLLRAPPFFSLIVTPADRRHRRLQTYSNSISTYPFRFLHCKLPQ
jgi:hypothetical protein